MSVICRLRFSSWQKFIQLQVYHHKSVKSIKNSINNIMSALQQHSLSSDLCRRLETRFDCPLHI